MKTNLKFIVCALLLIICSISQSALSQSAAPAGTGPKSEATPQEIQKLKEAVEANPDSLSAHKAYITAMRVMFDKTTNPELIAQYKKWMEKYPNNTNFPFAIGEALWGGELPEAKEYLLKVVQMDPKNATAWYYLSIDADRWGQQDLSMEYMKKASLADPSDAGYAFYYLDSMQDEAPAVYSQKVFDFTKRFPDSERGAQALYWLAERSVNNDDKIKYFEDLRNLYPPAKFDWSAGGMSSLWAAYMEVDPVKAQVLANEVGIDDKRWKAIMAFTENILQERKLVEDHKYSDAVTLLAQTKLPQYLGVDDFFYTEEAFVLDKAGNTKGAYDSLATRFAETPTDKLLTTTESYGEKLGKSKTDVEKDVQTIRNSKAKPAAPFNLGLYTSNGKLSLDDLKGKVVLLTFWFPGCGPCRGEFPHFQAVMNGYKDQQVAFIGINVEAEQDTYVLPFMQNTKYSFVPLRGIHGTTKDYGVQGEPTNFLIDQNGKIVFRDFRINGNNHRTLELMINSLLNKP
jgi:thiol-disulfide isomerase/thioredoxin/TolA-binding protein